MAKKGFTEKSDMENLRGYNRPRRPKRGSGSDHDKSGRTERRIAAEEHKTAQARAARRKAEIEADWSPKSKQEVSMATPIEEELRQEGPTPIDGSGKRIGTKRSPEDERSMYYSEPHRKNVVYKNETKAERAERRRAEREKDGLIEAMGKVEKEPPVEETEETEEMEEARIEREGSRRKAA